MAAERSLRVLLACVALALLALGAEAQRRGGGKGKGKGRGPADEPGVERPGAEQLPPIYLPGFEPAGPSGGKKASPQKKGGKPGAKAGAKPAAKPEPPPDPMTEADDVTALADHRARLEEAEERLVREHFGLCDLDENGWISLREAEVSLSFDRTEYRRTDADQDGRIDPAEFSGQRAFLLARLGALPAGEAAEVPTPAAPEAPAPPSAAPSPAAPVSEPPAADARAGAREQRSELGTMRVKPAGLLRRYDGNGNRAVDLAELEKATGELGLTLSAAQTVDVLDRNDSGTLEASELLPLAWMASQALPEPEPTPAAPPPAAADASAAPASEPREPPSAGAGKTHFSRLDPGHDGFIDESDLRALQSPARLDLRLKAVLSAMDRDGDGRLSEAEFDAAMSDAR